MGIGKVGNQVKKQKRRLLAGAFALEVYVVNRILINRVLAQCNGEGYVGIVGARGRGTVFSARLVT